MSLRRYPLLAVSFVLLELLVALSRDAVADALARLRGVLWRRRAGW